MNNVQPQLLKDLIKISGLKTQKAFAEKQKIDASFLSEVLSGKSEYRPATLELIALDEGFEIEMSYKLIKITK